MLVFILLQAGADPNQVDDKMKTPMRMAAKAGHSDIVEYLLSKNGASEIKVCEKIICVWFSKISYTFIQKLINEYY